MARIQTPDQRVRVFISSTMKELAAERVAVREAVEGLHLIPILFELGARPHPPKELYLAYLHQSHVFLGIYWQQYGWIAPGETVPGLEDEYLASGDKPRLIYVKSPAPDRDPRLAAMLDRIANEGLSYRRFSTPEELAGLVADDLAVLLSERFGPPDLAEDRPPAAPARRSAHLPAPTNRFVGRGPELAELRRLLTSDDVRLVTLVGPGGIGKTRLAMAAAAEVAEHYPDGVLPVLLAALRDPEGLWPVWWEWSVFDEGLGWMQAALQDPALGVEGRATAEYVRGSLAFGQGDPETAGQALEEPRRLHRQLGDDVRAACDAILLGIVVNVVGPARGEQLEREAVEVLRRTGEPWKLAFSLFALGRVLVVNGRAAEAVPLLEESVRVQRAGEHGPPSGPRLLLGYAMIKLGWAHLGLDDADAAGSAFRTTLSTAGEADQQLRARALEGLAAAALHRGTRGGEPSSSAAPRRCGGRSAAGCGSPTSRSTRRPRRSSGRLSVHRTTQPRSRKGCARLPTS